GKFSVGDFQIGRIVTKPTLNFASPVRDDKGKVQRVLYAALDVSLLSAALAQIHLPAGGTIAVIDRKGNIVAHCPSPASWVGKNFSDTPLVRQVFDKKEGVFECPGLTKLPELHSVTRIKDGSSAGLFVSVNIPLSVCFAPADEA